MKDNIKGILLDFTYECGRKWLDRSFKIKHITANEHMYWISWLNSQWGIKKNIATRYAHEQRIQLGKGV